MFNKDSLAPDADFLISSIASDHAWAEWIAWQLEEARYTVIYEGWFPSGTNRVIALNQKVRCTIAILSTEYLNATRIDNNRVNQEDQGISSIMWLGAFVKDPSGRQGYLLPVRVSQCQPSGLLANLVCLDFIGLDEENAREKLRAAVRPKNDISRLGRFGTHQTISTPPVFPGAPSIPVPKKQRHLLFSKSWYAILAVLVMVAIIFGGWRLIGGISPHTFCLATSLPDDNPAAAAILHGVELAFNQSSGYNATNNVVSLPNGYQLVKYEIDDQSYKAGSLPDPTQALKSLNDLVNSNNPNCPNPIAVIGPYYSAVAEKEIPIAAQAGLLLLSPSNTAPCLTKPVCSKYNQIHPTSSDQTSYARLPDTDTNQGNKVAEFLKKTFSPQKIEIVDDGEIYGDDLSATVIQNIRVYSPQAQIWLDCPADGKSSFCSSTTTDKLLTITSYKDISSLKDIIQKLHKPNVIFFGGLASGGAGQLRTLLGHTIPFVVPSDCVVNDRQFFDTVGPDAQNIYATFPEADPSSFAAGTNGGNFVKYYTPSYGKPGRYSANGFDAAQIIMNALETIINDGKQPTMRVVSKAVLNNEFTTKNLIHQVSFNNNGDNNALPTYTIYKSQQNSKSQEWNWAVDTTITE